MKLPEIDLDELEKIKEDNFREIEISGYVYPMVEKDRQRKAELGSKINNK